MTKEKRVGIFVAVGLVILAAGIFLIGQNRKLWERKVTYTAVYANVSGLRAGSPVSMGGVDVGTVAAVKYAKDANDVHIYVTIEVVRAQAERIHAPVMEGKKVIRKGTVANIVNKGLLGDKMIDLSIAQPGTPVLDPLMPLETEEPLDLSTYVAKIDDIAQKASGVLSNLQEATNAFADPTFANNLKDGVGSLRDVLDGVAHKDGFAHRIIFDKAEADRYDSILANLQGSTAHLNAVMADVQDVSLHVRQGPGIAHAVVYDGELSSNAAGSLAEVHKDLERIRTGNGLIHALVYGDADSQHLMGNFNAMSDDLRAIVSGVRQGKGSIGGLLVDPSIYEDLKSLLGNVERNQVLRALVRYSIKQDDLQTPVAPVLAKPKDEK